MFQLVSNFKPAGDQPAAIKELTDGVLENQRHQVLLGVTGSGKTFTIANVIANINKPTLVISHNKTLAAQLYSEFKQFFPHNAVEYFVSYYDYYQPEAYIPQTDTYIEKDASINEHIDRLRLKATSSLLERRDVIVVASVSCIYNLGSPNDYKEMSVLIEKGRTKSRDLLLKELVEINYQRNDIDFTRGKFRVHGDTIEIFPAYLETALRVEFFGDEIQKISEIEPLTGKTIPQSHNRTIPQYFIYPAKHFVLARPKLEKAVEEIKKELKGQVQFFRNHGKLLEAERLEQRTNYDIEMLLECGYCHGIENYSRHLSGRLPGERPSCLIDYFIYPHRIASPSRSTRPNSSTQQSEAGGASDFLVIIDESHVTIPQIYGMYEGDKSRKKTLIDFGFRLPSALDNRPLNFTEFESLLPCAVYVSATPAEYELKKSKGVIVEQIVRPTGLVDPEVLLRSTEKQIENLIKEIEKRAKRKERILITTLTKKMAEELTDYLIDNNLNVRYLHSDIDALKRIEILRDLRKGEFDCLVGINLLREGLDLPEVSLVAVLDADKEGFLRSQTSLIQVCGRASRNINGEVILYADTLTGSMKRAIDEMSRRRDKQIEYNKKYKIKPKTIVKAVAELEEFSYQAKKDSLNFIREDGAKYTSKENIPNIIKELERQMKESSDALDFELATIFRDKIFELKNQLVKQKRP